VLCVLSPSSCEVVRDPTVPVSRLRTMGPMLAVIPSADATCKLEAGVSTESTVLSGEAYQQYCKEEGVESTVWCLKAYCTHK